MLGTFQYLVAPSKSKQDKLTRKRNRQTADSTQTAVIAPVAYDDSQVLMLHPAASLAENPARTILSSTLPFPFNYTLFESPQDALDWVLNSRNRHFFYQIEEGRPVRAYMDIEFPCALEDLDPAEQRAHRVRFAQTCRRLVAYFCCYVDAVYLMRAVAQGLYDGQWYFYSACTGYKMSMHAHSNLLFRNVEELNKVITNFIKLLRQMRITEFFFGTTTDPLRYCILDGKVYTPRPFRLAFNAKLAGDTNYLMPLDDDEQHRSLNVRQHLAQGFVHPVRTLHDIPLDPGNDDGLFVPHWPEELRQRIQSALLYDANWPCRAMEDVDRAVWNACAACGLVPSDYSIDSEPPHQLYTGALVRADVEGVFMGHGAQVAELRQQWLLAMAVMIEMLYCQMRHDPDRVSFMQTIVQKSYEGYISHRQWSERLQQVGEVVGLARCPYASRHEQLSAQDQFQPNMYLEMLFCLFYLRTRVYDQMASDALAAGEPNCLTQFLTAQQVEWPQSVADSADLIRFKTFPLRLFGMPALMCTINQIEVLVARNSLYDDCTHQDDRAATFQ